MVISGIRHVEVEMTVSDRLPLVELVRFVEIYDEEVGA